MLRVNEPARGDGRLAGETTPPSEGPERLTVPASRRPRACGADEELRLGDRDDADALCELEGGATAACPREALPEILLCKNDRIGVCERADTV